METIIIKLDSKEMENPDLDIRYLLPEMIEEYTSKKILDNGYDYITNNELGLWLETENAEEMVDSVIELIKTKKVLDNDLAKCSEIYISPKECSEICDARKVFPV